jgi:hypothetical protein
MTHQNNASLQACISNCLDCHRICLETVTHCLQKGGDHAKADHIALLLTCADICQTSANAMLHGAAVHKYTCGACAAICRECAKACTAMADDTAMKACADVCSRCAESCQSMAG